MVPGRLSLTGSRGIHKSRHYGETLDTGLEFRRTRRFGRGIMPPLSDTMRLEADIRSRIEEFVLPLYTTLDGVQTFDRVVRIERRVWELAGDEDLDGRLLELLVLFHGVTDRLGSLGRQSRFALILRGLSLPEDMIERSRIGLQRFSEGPETSEERILHDAWLLEESGLRAVVARLLMAGRRRWTVERALETLGPGPVAERFYTSAGAATATRRRQEVAAWIDGLRRSLRQETPDS